jgi:hypothetical protein
MVGLVDDDQRAVPEERKTIFSEPRGQRLNGRYHGRGHVVSRRRRVGISSPQAHDPELGPVFAAVAPDLAEALDGLVAQLVRLRNPQYVFVADFRREHVLDRRLDRDPRFPGAGPAS